MSSPLPPASPLNVIYDVDSIEFGLDFRDVIAETLEGVDVVLVLIGKNWEPKRLQAATDYVRVEIPEAFRQGKRVVPCCSMTPRCPRETCSRRIWETSPT